MTTASTSPLIRAYQPTDLDAVIAIFVGAIREVAARDYDPAQIDAWSRVDRQRWEVRRLSRPTWIAVLGEAPVGFTDLEPDGHLDMMFVHPAHQGVGVATALLATVEAAARARGLPRLFTEASITAKPFFARRGFSVLGPQLVGAPGRQLMNFRMEKRLV
jgi:putative acetyltransferase